jgi:hypothetical protein
VGNEQGGKLSHGVSFFIWGGVGRVNMWTILIGLGCEINTFSKTRLSQYPQQFAVRWVGMPGEPVIDAIGINDPVRYAAVSGA